MSRTAQAIGCSPAHSTMRCYEAHAQDAARLCGVHHYDATAYKLSPEYRQHLLRSGRLTMRFDPTPRKWSRPHPRKMTFTPDEEATILRMDDDGKSCYQITAHIGRASYPVIHKTLQRLRKERRERLIS